VTVTHEQILALLVLKDMRIAQLEAEANCLRGDLAATVMERDNLLTLSKVADQPTDFESRMNNISGQMLEAMDRITTNGQAG